MKLFKKSLSLLLSAVILFGVFSLTAIPSYAATPVDYTFGEEWQGYVNFNNTQVFKISVSVKSHIYISFKAETDDICIKIVDSSDETVFDDSLTDWTYNNNSGFYDYTYSCNLKAGEYEIIVSRNVSNYYLVSSFFCFSEPVVSLSTPVISAISSPSGGAFTVGCEKIKNALTYEVQYSTSSTFSSAKTKASPSPKIKVTGLKKGTYYYVRMRAYTVYNDGMKVYSNWSRAQSVYVKKLTNTVTISTASKKVAYSTLQKKNVSFIVVAQDKADAAFKFSLSSIPEKLKGKISINASTGQITLKKGIAKGTYSVKVTVTAAATASYNKASAAKTIKITVS